MNKQDWIDYFELINGRKPSPEEYFAAKANGDFVEDEVSSSEPNQSEQATVKGEIEESESAVPIYQSSPSADISQANSPYPYERTYVVDERGENIGFGRAISDYFRGYFDFKGYTTRKGYESTYIYP